MSSDLDKEVARISNLKQNQKKDKAYLENLARISLWKRQIDLKSRFSRTEDAELAENLFNSYLENYEISSYNDVQNVSDLVFEETLKQRLQKDIDRILADENTKFVPDKIIASLHEIEERIWKLKEKIGITSQTAKKDDLTALQELEDRFSVYVPFHRNEFSTVCGSCGKVLLLRRRCGKDKFDNLVHPMFSGRFYYNRRGIELVKAGIWTKEQYAFVFFTSPQYVDWCIENEHKIVEIDGVEPEKIEKFIKENPFLKDVVVPSKILEENKNEK